MVALQTGLASSIAGVAPLGFPLRVRVELVPVSTVSVLSGGHLGVFHVVLLGVFVGLDTENFVVRIGGAVTHSAMAIAGDCGRLSRVRVLVRVLDVGDGGIGFFLG